MKIFGILNLTPDSFSDGGEFNATNDAIKRAHQIIEQGADYIDIGAESTRPGASPLSSEEELARLLPFLTSFSAEPVLSIDTYHPETAKALSRFDQIKFLNDVSGFKNPEMVKIARDSDVNIIVMHSLTIPADKNIVVTTPIISTLQDWIEEKFTTLTAAGITPARISFDPGIGFGKTPEQSLEIIEKAEVLAKICHSLGTKIYYGHSRKSFLGGSVEGRDQATAEISVKLYNKGVDFIRVHNVKANLTAVKENSH